MDFSIHDLLLIRCRAHLLKAILFSLLVLTVILLSASSRSALLQQHPRTPVPTKVTGERSAVNEALSEGSHEGKLPTVDTDFEDTENPGLSKLRQDGLTRDLARVDIDQLTSQQIMLTGHSYLDNTDVICKRKLRMGNMGDGGWEICDDPDVRPRPPCIIYSYGINYDYSFDLDSSGVYGCHVYSFDPSMTKEKDQFNKTPLVHFYKIGLANETFTDTKGWKLYTHKAVRKLLGHSNSTIDIIKMDIEYSEKDALPEMIEAGQMADVKQYYVEFHLEGLEEMKRLLKTLQMLEKEGFRRFLVHKNIACQIRVQGCPVLRTSCYELHYLRR